MLHEIVARELALHAYVWVVQSCGLGGRRYGSPVLWTRDDAAGAWHPYVDTAPGGLERNCTRNTRASLDAALAFAWRPGCVV